MAAARGTRTARVQQAAALLAGFCIVALPIVFFNYRDYGLLSVSTSQQLGFSMLLGTNQAAQGMWNQEDEDLADRLAAERGWDRRIETWSQRDQLMRDVALGRIRQAPGTFVNRSDISPPVQLSATPSVYPPTVSFSATISSMLRARSGA